jgi:hypothetical protein
MELDAMTVSTQPQDAFLVEVVARAVVDDEEDFSARIVSDEPLEKFEECLAVEDLGEAKKTASIVECDGTIDMSGLAGTERIYARLNAYP